MRMAIPSNLLHRFNVLPIKIPTAYRSRENNPNIHIRTRNDRIAKSVLGNKTKASSVEIFDFKLYYKSTMIKMTQY